MSILRSVRSVTSSTQPPPWSRRPPLLAAAASLLGLAIGCLFVTPIIAQLGVFPTLFAAAIVTCGIAMQLAALFHADLRL